SSGKPRLKRAGAVCSVLVTCLEVVHFSYQARSLMREAGVECRQRRRWRCTTDSNHAQAVAPNRLQRAFQVSEPNRVWVADLTAIWTLQGWLYLAAVLDLRDRQLVGWAMAGHMRTELALEALDMALGAGVRCGS